MRLQVSDKGGLRPGGAGRIASPDTNRFHRCAARAKREALAERYGPAAAIRPAPPSTLAFPRGHCTQRETTLPGMGQSARVSAKRRAGIWDARRIDIETRTRRSPRVQDRLALRKESSARAFSMEGGSAMSLRETASLSKRLARRASLAAVKMISVARSDITRPTGRRPTPLLAPV